jgi:hypothetical protein
MTRNYLLVLLEVQITGHTFWRKKNMATGRYIMDEEERKQHLRYVPANGM